MDKKRWIVVVPREEGRWREVGVAFQNENGSINVILDALPVDGKLQLQVPKTNSKP